MFNFDAVYTTVLVITKILKGFGVPLRVYIYYNIITNAKIKKKI